MVCESWKSKLDAYIDGELLEEEQRTFDAHVQKCSSCSIDALARVQMKRAVRSAGKRFIPSADLRKQVQQSITPKSPRNSLRQWALAAAAVVLVAGAMGSIYWQNQSIQRHIFSEITDMHVATLASSSPVDVVSTDRHTVKPWFQGKIPFAFNLPEVQNTGFTLIGGRVSYLDQTPGAHLIYDVRKHHISVFIFQERSLPLQLGGNSLSTKDVPFNTETWSQGGLRYFVIGDAGVADIKGLAKLFHAE
jgi:anti-sigma factor RsiW